MVKRAALILAGGRARRFQSIDKVWQDKALAKLSGKPLLIHAIENVQSVVDEIAISVNEEQRRAKYEQILKKYALTEVHFVVDEEIDGTSGPNVAIMSGLRALKTDFCLTLPCDMPFLKPAVAEFLFNEAADVEVAVPMWPSGRLETLLMVLKRYVALQITDSLCSLKRPRSDDIPRGASKLLLASPMNHIKTLDPELKSFININSREDLCKLQTRRAHGPVKENLRLNANALAISDLQLLRKGGELMQEGKLSEAQMTFGRTTSNFEFSNSHFWAALSGENQGETFLKLSQHQPDPKTAVELDFEGKETFVEAANNYRLEAEMYDENRCRLLAERAWADKSWCESWAMGKYCHAHRYPSKIR